MSKKVPSKKTYKICYIISLIVSILCFLIGIPTITVGGIFFVIIGLFSLFLFQNYKKIYTNYDITYNQTAAVKEVAKSVKKPAAPVEKTTPTTDFPESLTDVDKLMVKPDITSIVSPMEKHHVAGTSYRQNEIKSLGIENSDYSLTKKEIEELYLDDDRIYEFDFTVNKVELIEEPTNEYDPNAIKVVIDDVHVGYIKKGSCSHVKKLMRENKIKNLEADIHGGKYKCLEYDCDTDKYRVRRDTSDFFVDLYIYKKE